MAMRHALGYEASPDAEIVALCDLDPGAAQAFQARHVGRGSTTSTPPIGIVGCGNRGKTYARADASLEDVQLVACPDPIREAPEPVATEQQMPASAISTDCWEMRASKELMFSRCESSRRRGWTCPWISRTHHATR